VLVVLHVPATGGATLPRILDRSGPLAADTAVNGEKLRHGRVYVAPPDKHMLVVDDMVRLSRGPWENGLRPAADPLFRSAGLSAGPRVAAVVLSGTLDDAALGAATVERHQGLVIIQDPEDADYDSMPRCALATTERAVVLPAVKLAAAVVEAATEEVGVAGTGPADPPGELRAEIEKMLAGVSETDPEAHVYSGLICPECGGPLYHSPARNAKSFDCLVGHRWSPRSLLEEQSASVERALWLAIRTLDERGRLTARLADEALLHGHELSARQFLETSREARESSDAIRDVAISLAEVDPKNENA
jgi:two-component system chemotaxis response regulator CheB